MHLGGPPKTGQFKGFGFGAPKAGGAPGARPAVGGFSLSKPAAGSAASLPSARKPKPGAAGGGVSALFKESLEEDDVAKQKKNALPAWAKPTEQHKAAERLAQEALQADSTVFQYDEVFEDIKDESGQEAVAQAVRADALTQKKRVGLTVPKGAEAVATGAKRQAKYVEKVMIATDRRKVEQQIIEDRLLKKEKDARKDCEVFVTEAFKEELKKRKKFEEDMERQDARDSILAAEKQENGKGFADMYRNLLNGGLASSRGGEKLKEVAPAKEELVKEEEEEEVDEVKAEMKEEDVKMEDEEGEGGSLGVEDAGPKRKAAKTEEPPAPPPKTAEEIAAEEAAAKVQREEKAMSAKERYLARKKAAAAAAAEE